MSIDALCILFTLLMMFLALMRCTHAWESVDREEIPSPIEVGRKAGLASVHYTTNQLPFLLQRKVIIVLKCPNCGSVKIIRA